MRVYVEVAGCDRRRLDAESIRSYLEANGHELVDDPSRADRILAVVCAFKEKEEDESVRRLRSLRKYGRDILVYGCLADIAGERYVEFNDLPSISPREIETIDQHFEGTTIPFADVRDANVVARQGFDLVRVRRRFEAGIVPSPRESVAWLRKRGLKRLGRPFATTKGPFSLFVCRGCAGSCSYCAIRRAVGSVHSKPVDAVLSEFHTGIAEGYRTFNILGDDPGCYGLDLATSLPQLLGALFDASGASETSVKTRSSGATPIRFNIREIHPKHLIGFSAEMLDLADLSRVENILVPIQSGSDRVLGLMEREHSAAELLQALRSIRERCPSVTLDTQIIVGFPTETEADFKSTLDFVKDAGFDSVVVFPYDDKERTVASELAGKVPQEEVQRRVQSAFRYLHRAQITAYRSCP